LPAASWDGATARALAAPQVALGLAVPLVRSGGLALLMLGPEDPLPAHPRATLFHVEHYRVDGRSRRSALWTVDATPPSP
jgi:16S rRNA G527 N7-methylase RsmG